MLPHVSIAMIQNESTHNAIIPPPPLNNVYCRFTSGYPDFGTYISFPVVRTMT